MTPAEKYALFRLCIKAGVFTLDEFLEEVPRAEAFDRKLREAKVTAPQMNRSIEDVTEQIEDAKTRISELTATYLEHGKVL